MNVDVRVDSKEVTELLYKLERRTTAASLRMFLRAFVWPHLQQRIVRRFANEGDEAVGQWAQLAEATARIRRVRGFSAYQGYHPINVRTGQMKSFATSSHRVSTVGTGGAALHLPGAGMSAIIRRKIQVAQVGGSGQSSRRPGPNRPAPPRPIYALDQVDESIIGNGLLDWIRSGGTSGI